jgi:cyclopropane fatty-acyl-phospholipid synthase-like methyltransferase
VEHQLPFAPACERNKQPILEVLQQVLPPSGRVLEIGSGTGQHVVHFAENLPDLQWQPSEQSQNLAGLQARLDQQAGANVLSAIELDVAAAWPELDVVAIISANTAHIMSWPEVLGMFDGVARLLKPGGVFSLYGPFNSNGEYTSASNQQFDLQLKSQNPHMGLRDVTALEKLAQRRQMYLAQQVPMPANNQILLFRKQA